MIWPFVSRGHHVNRINQLQQAQYLQATVILDLEHTIEEKDKQILALTELINTAKCNDYTSAGRKTAKTDEFAPQGRSGWRTRSQRASDLTVPKDNDSVEALKQRVANDGGTV